MPNVALIIFANLLHLQEYKAFLLSTSIWECLGLSNFIHKETMQGQLGDLPVAHSIQQSTTLTFQEECHSNPSSSVSMSIAVLLVWTRILNFPDYIFPDFLSIPFTFGKLLLAFGYTNSWSCCQEKKVISDSMFCFLPFSLKRTKAAYNIT